MISRRLSLRPKQLVKRGYNKIGTEYTASRRVDSEDIRELRQLVDRLAKGARVLDAGCGSGYPVTRLFANAFQVIGVDFAEKQIRSAKEKVPDAKLVCADITNLPFRENTFDAVCSYYAIIHIPRRDHRKLLVDFGRILRPAGLMLVCMGAGDISEDVSDYHGTQMFWSHYDKETNLAMIQEIGFDILWSQIIVENQASAHLFVLAQKR